MPKFCAICDNEDRNQCSGANNYMGSRRVRYKRCKCATCHDSRLIEVTLLIEVFEAPEEREVLPDPMLTSAIESKVIAAMEHARDSDRDLDFDFEMTDVGRTADLGAGEHLPTLDHVLDYLAGRAFDWRGRPVGPGENKEALEVARKAGGAIGRTVSGHTVLYP